MKKILNWTFGACFRTIGRLLAIFIIAALLIFIGSKLGFKLDSIFPIKVKAATVNQWADNLPALNRVQMYECGASNCYEKTTDFGGISTGGDGDRKYVFSSNRLTVDSSGGTVIQTTTGDVLNQGYLYLTKYYICMNPNISTYNYKIGNANYSTPNNFNAEILAQNDSALSTSPGITSIGYSSCRLFSGLYVPNTSGNNWTSIQFTSNNTQTTKFAIVSVETENLGLYTNTIKQIVESANGNVVSAVNGVKEETKKTNDTLNNDNVDESLTQADSFFNDFTTNTHGLTGIITAPLNAIQSLTSKSCSPLILPLPFVNENLTLPCMRQIYTEHFGSFMNLYDVIIIGIVSYWVLVRIFTLVKDFKNPDHDEIEVVDL